MHNRNEYLITQSELTRLGINPDLSCDITDPRNARYTFPLSGAAREKIAQEVASIIYNVQVVDEFDDGTTKEEADRVFEQCLVDARRTLCDPDYERLFGGGDDPLH